MGQDAELPTSGKHHVPTGSSTTSPCFAELAAIAMRLYSARCPGQLPEMLRSSSAQWSEILAFASHGLLGGNETSERTSAEP